jgi:hypothetical protein
MFQQGQIVQVRHVFGVEGRLSEPVRLLELTKKGSRGWEQWLVEEESGSKNVRWVTPGSIVVNPVNDNGQAVDETDHPVQPSKHKLRAQFAAAEAKAEAARAAAAKAPAPDPLQIIGRELGDLRGLLADLVAAQGRSAKLLAELCEFALPPH